MDQPTREVLPIGVFVASAVVVAASFMPWVSLKQSLPMGGFFPGMTVSIPSPTAWNSNVTFLGITVPNWLLVGVAIGAAVAGWLLADKRWSAPMSLLLGLPMYGICHSAFVLLMILILTSRGTGLGIGVVLTFLAFGGMCIATWKNLPPRRPAYQINEDPVQF